MRRLGLAFLLVLVSAFPAAADYIGDIALGSTIDCKFTTVSTTGLPTTLAGSPVISAYLGNDVTQLTAGITLSVDFDGVAGMHNIRVVATGANGYATATNYTLVITTGTVGGTSVVGYTPCSFSIERATAKLANVAHGGAAAALTLNNVVVNRTDAGTAVAITSSNGHAMASTAVGAGFNGLFLTASGDTGFVAQSTGAGGYGFRASGNGSGMGFAALGGATGNGIYALGGGTSGDGIRSTAQAGAGYGAALVGATSGSGLLALGGATGSGFLAQGGATSGDGIAATAPLLGHGLSLTGVGAAKNGLFATASGDTGMVVQSTGAGGYGFRASGNGVGHGIVGLGGATGAHGIFGLGGNAVTSTAGGHGVFGVGGNASTTAGGIGGHGVLGLGGNAAGGIVAGSGINGVGGTASGTAGGNAGNGLQGSGSGAVTASPAGSGLALYGGAASTDVLGVAGTGMFTQGGASAASTSKAGRGIIAIAGSATGAGGNAGMRIEGTGPGDEIALVIVGSGTGSGVAILGGATGEGVRILGGATSGDGIKVTTTSGHGINLAPVGTSMHGILSTGGNGGTSDGIKAVAGTGGVDIRGNITGNLVGTASTVTTVTGLTAANLDTTVSSRMATYTQPTGFLAATFPAGTVANTTNITAGVITTATNLTNAPTVGDLTAAMKASVNAEVVDTLSVDTYAEPGQGAPAATASLASKIGYLFKMMRNKITQTSTTLSVFDDAGVVVDHKATVSDNGTTYTRGELVSGP
jgi:hypothetical protein